MDKITIVLVVMTAVVAGMFNMMKIVEMKNNARNIVLDIAKDGKDVSKEHKRMLMTNDYLPMGIGIWIFLFIFAGSFAAIPIVFKLKNEALHWPEQCVCYGAAVFCLFAMVVDIVSTVTEWSFMKEHLAKIA